MPKTFTDNAAPVPPAAVNGPFQVVVPDDLGSFFKVDPAQGRVEAAGIARPVRRIHLATARTAGVASLATLDSAMDGRGVAANTDAGLYSMSFQLPADMDVTAVSNLKVLVAPAAEGGGGQVVRFELVTAHGKDGDPTLVTETVIYDWTTPEGWSPQDLKLVTMDAGGGHTFAGNKFEGADCVGVLIRRIGSAPQDTFNQTLILATGLVFEYTANRL